MPETKSPTVSNSNILFIIMDALGALMVKNTKLGEYRQCSPLIYSDMT